MDDPSKAAGEVVLWSVATGKLLCTFHHPNAFVARFSHDGKTLASGGDYTVRLWDLKERKLKATLDELGKETRIIGHKYLEELPCSIGFVESLAFGPKDDVVISGGGATIGIRWLGELIFWDMDGARK